MRFCQEVEKPVILGLRPAEFSEPRFGVLSLQGRQCGTGLLFPLHEGVFHPEPEQRLVLPCFFLVLHPPEEFVQTAVVIILMCQSEDAVPVDVRNAFGGVGLEVRHKAVVRRRIPDLIVSPFLLQV